MIHINSINESLVHNFDTQMKQSYPNGKSFNHGMSALTKQEDNAELKNEMTPNDGTDVGDNDL